MKIVLITSRLSGSSYYFVEKALKNREINIEAIIYSRGQLYSKKKYLIKKIKKLLRNGFSIIISGFYLRKIFDERKYLNCEGKLNELAKKNDITFISIARTSFLEKKDINQLISLDFDYGISIGNSYITTKILNLAKKYFINIHHEILPEYIGAQSIIWQIFNMSSKSGFTLHKMSSNIDEGEILYQEHHDLIFKDSVRETVQKNLKEIKLKSLDSLILLVTGKLNYMHINRTGSNSYTTPNIFQLIRIIRNHNKLKSFKMIDSTEL